MNKLLYATAAVGMLLAVNAAQAGDVLTVEQMDTVTAGVNQATVSTGVTNSFSAGSYSLLSLPTFSTGTITNTVTCLAAGCTQFQTATAHL